MFPSGSKSGGGAGLFKKPGMMGLGKKKFQMDEIAPTDKDQNIMKKVETKLLAPKINVKKLDRDDGQRATANNTYLAVGGGGNKNMLSKASLNQASGASINEKRVADNFVKPMGLQEKTQQSLAQHQ